MANRNKSSKKSENRKQGRQLLKSGIKGQYTDTLPQLAKTAGSALSTVSDVVSGNPIGAVSNGVKTITNGVKTVTKTIKHGWDMLKGTFKAITGQHPEWYENYPLNGLINLNYGRRLGTIESILRSTNSTSPYSFGVPTVVALDVVLTKPQTNTNDWNQAIQYLYSTIRSANSGSINYSMYDVERYVLDVRNIHAMYCYLRRAYASLNNMNLYDATIPRALLYAMGLNYDDFVSNAANLKEWSNKLSLQISTLLPLNIDLINRTRWMFSNIFNDSNDIKGSKYIFKLNYVTPFYDTTTPTITPKSFTYQGISFNSLTTYAQVYKFVNDYINNCINNDIYAVIAGDILKAFGASAIYPSEIWDDNMPTPLIYDEAALTQIQNASITGTINNANNYITYTVSDNSFVQQNSSISIITTNTINSQYAINGNNIYVNAYKDSMTPGETLSATRLSHSLSVENASGGNTIYSIRTCGTELVTDYRVVVRVSSNDIWSSSNYGIATITGSSSQIINNIVLMNSTSPQNAVIISAWSALDWSPLLFLYTLDDEKVNVIGVLWDFNNYAVTDSDNLSSLHGYAALSLLAVPRLVRQSSTQLLDK